MPLALVVVAVIVLLVVAFVVFPQVRAGVHTLLFVLQVLEVPVKPQSWLTRTPVRKRSPTPAPRVGWRLTFTGFPTGVPAPRSCCSWGPMPRAGTTPQSSTWAKLCPGPGSSP